MDEDLRLRARTCGPVVFVTSKYGRYREYDTMTLTQNYIRLGPEGFKAQYKFDWTPPPEMEARCRGYADRTR
jgi:hypothetical protein